MSTFAKKLESRKEKKAALGDNIMVIARAGTGKTTTSVEGLRRMLGLPASLNGTDEQEMIWEEMQKGETPKTVLATTFSRLLADELSQKLSGVPSVTACGLHQFGFRVIREQLGYKKPNAYATWNLIETIFGIKRKDCMKNNKQFFIYSAVEKLVSKCKITLSEPTLENCLELTTEYGIEVNNSLPIIVEKVQQILSYLVENITDLKEIHFDDQIFLPVKLGLSIPQYDFVVVDEAQDLNECQTRLTLSAGRRFMYIGDDLQAIFAFAGANSDSMDRICSSMNALESSTTSLKLTKTFRCGKVIAAEAKKIVPDYTAFETNGPGSVETINELNIEQHIKETWEENPVHGSLMVVCRTNAPLVNLVFKLIKDGTPAYIQGKDMVAGLKSIVSRSKATSVPEFLTYLSEYREKEFAKVAKSRKSTELSMVIEDKCDILTAFTENCQTTAQILQTIDAMFSDGTEYVPNPGKRKKTARKMNAVRLSSIHRSKGLESESVIFLHPELIPHQMSIGTSCELQEKNLRYIAITRARKSLSYVPSAKR